MNRRTTIERLPLGIQSFREIREGGYVYVDKTDMVWRLANGVKYNYLSRPRRFGKSLLVSTLQCYFEGCRNLFEGLRIMDLEEEWTVRPVFHLDMSTIGASVEELTNGLHAKLAIYDAQYGREPSEIEVSDHFAGLIRRAHQMTGQQVAVLIDEYDTPVRNSLNMASHEGIRNAYRTFLNVLKAEGEHIRFVFLTGIAKFTQLSLFSALNTLENLSFDPQFAAICGLTDEEIDRTFSAELGSMAEALAMPVGMLRQQMRECYDGYHFGKEVAGVYNPTSVIRALHHKELGYYWASDGAGQLLPQVLKEGNVTAESLHDLSIDIQTLQISDFVMSMPAVFLYQMGYLTIAATEGDMYLLKMPNQEVRYTLTKILLPSIFDGMGSADSDMVFRRMKTAMETADVDTAMTCLKQLISMKPFGNKNDDRIHEQDFQYLLYVIFSACGFYAVMEHTMACGRIDLVVKTQHFVYVMELKMDSNGGVKAAAGQMDKRHYTDVYSAEIRKVIPLAVSFSSTTRTIAEWKTVGALRHIDIETLRH